MKNYFLNDQNYVAHLEALAPPIRQTLAGEDAVFSVGDSDCGSDSDRLFEFVFNNPLIGMALVDLNGHYLRVNRFLCDLIGYSEEELLALDFQTITHPDDVERDSALIGVAMDRAFQREKRYIHKDGHVVHTTLTTSLFRHRDGSPQFFVSHFLDTTPKKQAEEALLLRESAITATTSGIAIVDARLPDMPLIYVNPAFVKMTGFEEEESLGRNCRFLQAEDCNQSELAVLRQAIRSGSFASVTLKNYRKDGTIFYNDLQISPIHNAAGDLTHFVGVMNDVTERLKTTQLLTDSEERLSEAQSTASIGSWDFHLATGKICWSAEMFRLLEFDPLAGVPPLDEILAKYGPEDMEQHKSAMARVTTDGKPYVRDMRMRLQEQGQVRWLEARGRGIFNEEGKVVRLVGTMLDITERKAAEERLQGLADALQRSNDSLQEFAFIASHDLKEPLRKIHAFGDMLKRKAGATLPLDCYEYVERMSNASTRLQTLVDGLLDYARLSKTTPRRVCVDLNAVMREVMSDLEPRIAETNGKVEVGELPTLAGDPMLMRQLMQNLVANALKFHKPHEAPVVRVYCENPTARIRSRIVVADNGIGFDPKYSRRIFGIFERLPAETSREGTGIGLAVCQRIVDSCGGAISAESAPGAGARFLVDLDTCSVN